MTCILRTLLPGTVSEVVRGICMNMEPHDLHHIICEFSGEGGMPTPSSSKMIIAIDDHTTKIYTAWHKHEASKPVEGRSRAVAIMS